MLAAASGGFCNVMGARSGFCGWEWAGLAPQCQGKLRRSGQARSAVMELHRSNSRTSAVPNLFLVVLAPCRACFSIYLWKLRTVASEKRWANCLETIEMGTRLKSGAWLLG